MVGASIAALCVAADNKWIFSRYQDTANKLIDAALADEAGLNRLEYLCYRIGNRLSGSAALDQAIAWGAEEMRRPGSPTFATIPVKVPHWVRGRESAEMLEPLQKPLFMLGLGGSVADAAGWHHGGRGRGLQFRRAREAGKTRRGRQDRPL